MIKSAMLNLGIIITGHWHNTQRRRACEQQNKRGDASVRPRNSITSICGGFVVPTSRTTNPPQTEVMEFALKPLLQLQ